MPLSQPTCYASRFEQVAKEDPEAETPDSSDVLGELAVATFIPGFRLFGDGHQLDVRLVARDQPFATNGQWDENTNQVVWSASLEGFQSGRPGTPTLLFAVYINPDEAVQVAHFGKLVLQGEALGNYCLWYRGLTDQEATQWQNFVDGLQARADVAGQVKAFGFAHEDPASAGDDLLSATPRALILAGLAEKTADELWAGLPAGTRTRT